MDKFESAARAALFEWADSIPEEFESFEHSEKYDKAIARLFDKMRDGRYHRFTRTTARVILAAAVLLLLVYALVFVYVQRLNVLSGIGGKE